MKNFNNSLLFYDNANLVNIKVDENNEVYKDINGNIYDKDGTTLVQYTAGKVDTSFIIPDSVERIESHAFCRCTHLESVIIQDSVTYMGAFAFQDDCPKLKDIYYTGSQAEWESFLYPSGWLLKDDTIHFDHIL